MSKRPSDSQRAPPTVPLLAGRRFRRFTAAKFLQLLGQNALIYGLFIAVISREDSSLATSAFVIASVVPSIILSVPAGVAADLLPKKLLLLFSMAARVAVVALFIRHDPGVSTTIVLTFLVWTAYQFFTPPENASLAAIVDEHRLPGAISLLHALSLVAQLAGAGIIAPLIVKLGGGEGLYWLVLVLFCTSTVLYAFIPDLSPVAGGTRRRAAWWRALPDGLRQITRDATLLRTSALKILADTGMMMVVVAAPQYVEDVLESGAASTVYIAVPGALGLGLGLLLAPWLMAFVSGRVLALSGFVLFTAVILALPVVDELRNASARSAAGALDLDASILVALLLLPFAGLGMGFVQVAARSETYRRAEPGTVGQVLATQSALGSTAALVPTLLSGALLDVLPVEAVLLLIGGSLAAFAVAAYVRFSRPLVSRA